MPRHRIKITKNTLKPMPYKQQEDTAIRSGWQFWVDRGGTFTDVVAMGPDAVVVTEKLLSEDPSNYSDAAIEGIRRILGVEMGSAIPTAQIAVVKMGTTVATNALLERQGEPTLLAITRGFADALRIGYQTRPRLFDLHISLPEMMYSEVLEVDERMGAQGEVVSPLDRSQAELGLQQAYARGLRSVAIVFMHGYRYPGHEQMVADLARKIGFTQISISSTVSPLIKLVSRGDTTVVDAYLSPILRRYVDQVAAELEGMQQSDGRLMFMQSNGGLAAAGHFQGKDAILSGPAGGVVGMVKTAAAAGFEKLIGFDMGGTSTDVSHYAGEYERAFETEVAGVRMRAPMMQIHTVAAGGGSILNYDGARFRVGPDSAGADPGPACYRKDGPLTITDCNLMLGKLQPAYFPAIFGPGADQSLDLERVEQGFRELAGKIEADTGHTRTPQQVAAGFLSIAVENMANAIKRISIQCGYDVTEYTLCCFGGAGGQHACLVADALGIRRIHLHPLAGVLSAYGMGLADQRVIHSKGTEQILNPELIPGLNLECDQLEAGGRQELGDQGVVHQRLTAERRVHLRYAGSDSSLLVTLADLEGMTSEFEQHHRQRFGFIAREKDIIAEAVQVEVIGRAETADIPMIQGQADAVPPVQATHPVVMGGELHATPFYLRHELRAGQRLDGPAVIIEETGTIVVEPGWRAELTQRGDMLLERYLPLPERVAIGTSVDPVMLEIFNNLFMSIADQMGMVLENTAVSVNIKERRDFSCALFDQRGDLVANAPHMPVHLGSMGESIKAVIQKHAGNMQRGDAYILNNPYDGGTHLPDITVVKPVFHGSGSTPIFYVAARGHHADIGGITPGSMPSVSSHLQQEGIMIDNIKLVDAGSMLEGEMRRLLGSDPYPARNIDYNIADLKAQLAACEKGMQELLRTVDHFGLDVVNAYMGHVQANAEESVRRVLDVLHDGEFCYEMDDGNRVCVKITLDRGGRSARVDFSGTSAQHPANYNAPRAICRAAVLYVFRCLVDDEIPLNEGCLKPITMVLPPNSMINPAYPAAVVAGNVETSQVIVDALFGALGVAAASQGTMNNFTWGNRQHQYYETICGGSGATADHPGTDAVHTHMTNSRLTDPEVLEWRFPVRLEEFSIRRGSGGAGRQPGGNGTVRKLRFLEPMTANILAGHRRVAPYGMGGGGPGKAGCNYLQHQDGHRTEFPAQGQVDAKAGDVMVIETPGGGGFGAVTD
jgi:5-oxoprolinase (ATP-hydrolysing)